MRKNYQGMQDKSKRKFEVIDSGRFCGVLGNRELLVEVPLPMVEVWEELQAQVEQLTGEAGLRIIGAILENEVTRRVGPPHRPDPVSGAVRWGRQPGYVMFGGQKVALERPRVRTREGQEVDLDSYARLQHDGRRQRAVREGIVAGLTSRNYRRAVQSVIDGYGIEKSSRVPHALRFLQSVRVYGPKRRMIDEGPSACPQAKSSFRSRSRRKAAIKPVRSAFPFSPKPILSTN